MDKIILVKLVTGEEVIGRVKNETVGDDTYTLIKPHTLAVVPVNQHQMQVQFIPFLVGAQDSDVEIKKNQIIAKAVNIPKPLEDRYLSTTTGLDITPQVETKPKVITK